jgi:hypothetical protein
MTTQLPIPKELLQEIADTEHVQCGDAAAMARALLAAYEQEPVPNYIGSKNALDSIVAFIKATTTQHSTTTTACLNDCLLITARVFLLM